MIAKSMMDAKCIMNLGQLGKDYLEKYNIKSGKMLQIGGTARDTKTGEFRKHREHHPFFFKLEYYSLDLEYDGSKNTIVGDITNCPQISDNSYDFVFSSDTFEHIKEPWKAAKEMKRILKPGGICFIYTSFSWRYHAIPIDYWRFTPQCLVFLFEGLECLEANCDDRNRRQDHRGGDQQEKYYDGVPLDNMGGFRENWRVYYVGHKKKKD